MDESSNRIQCLLAWADKEKIPRDVIIQETLKQLVIGGSMFGLVKALEPYGKSANGSQKTQEKASPGKGDRQDPEVSGQ